MRRWRTAGPALLADRLDEVLRGLERDLRIVARRSLVAEGRTGAERRLDPPRRRADADPEPVVLADEEERERQALVGQVRGAVQARLRGGVVDRGVAEAADDDRVRGPGRRDAELPRPLDRERDADGARQVRGDRRRLRDDGERVVAEHLVPAPRDRLLPRGRDAPHDVRHPVPARLRRPREVEGARAVVEERRVGRPQRERDRRVRLVPRGGDGVEAPARVLQGARREVAEPAAHLRAPERLGVGGVAAVAVRKRAQALDEMRLEGVELHPAQPASLRPGARDPARCPAP